MKAAPCAAAALVGAVVASAAAWAAPPCRLSPADGRVLRDGALQMAWRTEPAVVVQGQPFVLLLRACPADAQAVKVDATMPEHRHGMNYRPAIQPLGGGRYRVEGLLWHMSGRWQWRFEWRAGAAPSSAAPRVLLDDVVLP